MVLTEAQLQEIAKRVRAIIRAESKGVGDLPVATSLDGLLSLPALRDRKSTRLNSSHTTVSRMPSSA